VTLDHIIRKASDSGFDGAEVAAFCAEHAITREDFADTVARIVATRYHSREIDFSFSDGVMNCLYGFITERGDLPMPPYSQSVFLAFDEGEYHHGGDPAGSDPEDLYTRPAIAEIVASDAQVT
jgi:hypothetical protein